MKTIQIENFGPVKSVSIDLEKKMQVFIGEQASGKSTICKVIYFCQKIKDYTLEFLMDSDQFLWNHQNEYFNNYMKFLRKQFMGCFGKTMHMQHFDIVYRFGEKYIKISLNKDGYIRFLLEKGLRDSIYELISDSTHMFAHELVNNMNSIVDRMSALVLLKQELRMKLCTLFESQGDILYIPAGRSLLATMSDQLQDVSISDMDLTMQDFINAIKNTKSRFGSKIPDMVREYTKTVRGQVSNESLDNAYDLIRKILKADYVSDNDGEKIYFDDRHWVKLMYGSSGQQEVLWILMLIFIIMLERKSNTVIIEEPEAHLFPIAQKNIVELISLLVNTTGSKVIITTHSPYILTSMNLFLYSDKVESRKKSKGLAIVPKNYRIAYDTFEAYCVDNRKAGKSIESLMDGESHMIQTDYIDEVSSITNTKLDKLIEREFEI